MTTKRVKGNVVKCDMERFAEFLIKELEDQKKNLLRDDYIQVGELRARNAAVNAVIVAVKMALKKSR